MIATGLGRPAFREIRVGHTERNGLVIDVVGIHHHDHGHATIRAAARRAPTSPMAVGVFDQRGVDLFPVAYERDLEES